MAINSGAINSHAINAGSAPGELLTLTASIQQTVIFLETYAITAAIEQSVFEQYAVVSGISQAVSAVLPATDAVIWELLVQLDGAPLADLTGELTVEAGENEARLAAFQIRPPAGAFTWSDYIGKSVEIDYTDNAGAFARVFTGIVDEVAYDVQTNIASFDCTNNRKGLIDAKTRQQLDAEIGGRWSRHIFDENADDNQYANDRLSTIPSAFETDAKNLFRLVPFAAAATAAQTLTESDILDGSVVPTFVSRDRLINKITLNFGYRFARLRHRERAYTWDLLTKATATSDGYFNWAEFLDNPTSFLPRDAVESAAGASGWVLKDDIVFTDLPAAGYFGGIGWTPKQAVFEVDERGNPIRGKTASIKDVSGIYTTSADFTLAQRFAQTITEQYSLNIEGTQSTAQYGDVEAETSRGVTANYDTQAWETFTAFKTPTGSVTANGDNVTDKTDVGDGGLAEFQEAIETAIAIEYRRIKDSHRQNYVDFEVLLDPTIDLHQTIEINTTVLQAKGKVVNVQHTGLIDGDTPSATTAVRLAISKAQGSASETTIAAPTRPTNTDASFVPVPLRLDSHFGNHLASRPYDEQWSGWVVNFRFQDAVSTTINRYPTAFIVDGQKIGDEDRKERVLDAPSTMVVEIPDETLVITAP